MKTKNALTSPQPSPRQNAGGGCLERLVRRPAKDRKDRLETVLAQAEKLDGDEAIQAWRRLCRELGHMAHPEARMPRFNGLLHAVWIAASNDQT